MIYEDEHVYVGHIDRNGKPNYLGHLMIDLKRHVPSLADLNPEEAKAFGLTMARTSKVLLQVERAEHVYAIVSGNSVPHLHMHLVARYPNTLEQFWGPFEVYDAPNVRMGGNSQLMDVCNRIKSFLESNPYE